MKVEDFEVFKFAENIYTVFENNGIEYLLNKSPYLDVVVTDHCPSDCKFCIADLVDEKLNNDLETMKTKITYAIKHMNVREVLLLGGEATISKHLIPLVKWLKEQDLDKIVLTTNGHALCSFSYCRQLFEAGLTHVNISLMHTNMETQMEINRTKNSLSREQLRIIYHTAEQHNVKLRINNNIFKGNNDTVADMMRFYLTVKEYCDSVKFSPLLPVDNFSVVNKKTVWAADNILSDDDVEKLFTSFEAYWRDGDMSIIENDLQFGFVKNTLIPLRTPIIMNWNFGKYTGMMEKVVKENKINNVKLLSNGELSLSWNRNLPGYFIKTD